MLKMEQYEDFCEAISYDAVTGEFRWRKTRGRIVAGTIAGTLKKDNGYREIKLFGRSFRAHRLVWFLMRQEWPPEEIDHINGVRDDNRWSNLRLATKQQNQFNRKTQRGSRLEVKGVFLESGGPTPYLAHIRKDGKLHRLGKFATIEDAKNARDVAERSMFGEFVRVGDAT